jgi:hypothetical protein
MTKIQRYEMNHKGLPEPDDNGVWVFREDHAAIVAALQEQVQQLAAENCIQDFIISAVRDLARESDGVSGWHLNGDIATWDQVLPELYHSETPATDAVIREISAKAVEGFGDVLGLGSLHLSLILKKCAYEHAAKLRVGEQPND